MDHELASDLIAAINTGRLVVFAGAGLSMAAPSSVPSARDLAVQCALMHHTLSGATLSPPESTDLEAQARHFFHRGDLTTHYAPLVVDWAPFRKPSNRGHQAIADFLCCKAIDFCVTTNFDTLVERAADELGATFNASLRAQEAAVAGDHAVLAKLHGCHLRQVAETLWCAEQLQEEFWQQRLGDWAAWLTGRLVGKDIVFVGYWTDWAYLNEVLASKLGADVPRSVILVAPAEPEELAAKAPGLWNWSHRDAIRFKHINESGDRFLDELRRRYSAHFLDSVMGVGTTAYRSRHNADGPASLGLGSTSADDMYNLRRDVTGAARSQPVKIKRPDQHFEIVGAFLKEAIATGATLQTASFVLGAHRFRVLNAAGMTLSSVRAAYQNAEPVDQTMTMMVCAGAHDDGGVPADIIRSGSESSIVRPRSTAAWLDHVQASRELGIQ